MVAVGGCWWMVMVMVCVGKLLLMVCWGVWLVVRVGGCCLPMTKFFPLKAFSGSLGKT
mgnify:CR=1 FL=1